MAIETSILLPAASVDLFLKDAATIEAARALHNDWRFARVKINIHDGDVTSAIRLYTASRSPEIIMVETDTTGESFVAKLGELSSHCESNTSAIVIGPVNDINLYRSLTAMGVSDYLVRSVPVETLAEVIAHNLIQKLGAAGSRLIALVGAKGGVGVSTIAQAMGWVASEMLDQKTLLLDAAGAWSSHGVAMGFEPVASTAEAIKAVLANDTDSIRRMLFQANDKFFVLATGTEPMLETATQIAHFEDILNTAMSGYPVVIADLSGAIPSVKKAVLSRAHEIVVVATPTLAALRGARALTQEIRKIHGGEAARIELVVNMSGIAGSKDVSHADIKTALEMDSDTVIPFDPKLFIGAEHEGKKLSADKAGQEIMQKILPLLRKVILKDAVGPKADEGFIGSLLGKIKTKK